MVCTQLAGKIDSPLMGAEASLSDSVLLRTLHHQLLYGLLTILVALNPSQLH